MIEGLDGLVNLESLFLGKNKISKLQNLGCLKKLKVLSIQVQKKRVVRAFMLEFQSYNTSGVVQQGSKSLFTANSPLHFYFSLPPSPCTEVAIVC